jgi:hypothetical protein
MSLCPFCGEEIAEGKTFCSRCGYSTTLALPYPHVKVNFSNLLFALLGLIAGIGSCIFSLIPSLNYVGFLLVLTALGFSGITLERLTRKMDTVPLKILAVYFLQFQNAGQRESCIRLRRGVLQYAPTTS